MKDENTNIETFKIPAGVTATLNNGIINFKGAKGEVSKSFDHPLIDITIENNEINFSSVKEGKVSKKILQTFMAHAKNLCKGVSKGHTYVMKICSGHFPMNVSYKNNMLEIKNFIGEAVPRTIVIKPGVELKLEASIITLTGIDKELTSQVAASIEKLTRRNGFDKRRFQDGIYIIEKDGFKIE